MPTTFGHKTFLRQTFGQRIVIKEACWPYKRGLVASTKLPIRKWYQVVFIKSLFNKAYRKLFFLSLKKFALRQERQLHLVHFNLFKKTFSFHFYFKGKKAFKKFWKKFLRNHFLEGFPFHRKSSFQAFPLIVFSTFWNKNRRFFFKSGHSKIILFRRDVVRQKDTIYVVSDRLRTQ